MSLDSDNEDVRAGKGRQDGGGSIVQAQDPIFRNVMRWSWSLHMFPVFSPTHLSDGALRYAKLLCENRAEIPASRMGANNADSFFGDKRSRISFSYRSGSMSGSVCHVFFSCRPPKIGRHVVEIISIVMGYLMLVAGSLAKKTHSHKLMDVYRKWLPIMGWSHMASSVRKHCLFKKTLFHASKSSNALHSAKVTDQVIGEMRRSAPLFGFHPSSYQPALAEGSQ